MQTLGLIIVASVFFSHSLDMIGADGWTVVDLFLPLATGAFAVLAIMQHNLTRRMRGASWLPLALFVVMAVHIFSDPRIGEIADQLSRTRLPTGGFRLYYDIGIAVLLYYAAQLIVHDEAKLNKLVRIYFGIMLFQVLFTYVRVVFNIPKVPWDSYSSQIMQYDPNGYWGQGTRLIILGDAAMHLFIFALVFMKPGARWRALLIVLAIVSIIYSKGRSPLMSAMLVLFLYMVLERKLWIPAFGMAGAVISVLLFFAVFPESLEGMPATPKRFLSILAPDNPEYQTDTFSRMEMWKLQIYVIQRNPWWGSMSDFPVTADEDSKTAVTRGDTHGAYLGTAALFGIPVVLLWLCMILRQMLRSYDLWRRNARDSEAHKYGLWLLLLYCAYLWKYLTAGGAGGGSDEFFMLFAMVDIACKVMPRVPAPVLAAVRRVAPGALPHTLSRRRPQPDA